MPKERFKIISAAYLMLIKENKILLSRRYNTGFHDGEYSFPAGHLNGGETLLQALIREVLEEIGIVLTSQEVTLVQVMHRKEMDGERMNFFFNAKHWMGEPTIMEADKCDDLQWFSLDQLPPTIIPYIREAINNYRQGIRYGEFGWIDNV